MGGVTPAYNKKNHLKSFHEVSFQCFPSFLGIENSAKCSSFMTGCFVSNLPKYLQLENVISILLAIKNFTPNFANNVNAISTAQTLSGLFGD